MGPGAAISSLMLKSILPHIRHQCSQIFLCTPPAHLKLAYVHTRVSENKLVSEVWDREGRVKLGWGHRAAGCDGDTFLVQGTPGTLLLDVCWGQGKDAEPTGSLPAA